MLSWVPVVVGLLSGLAVAGVLSLVRGGRAPRVHWATALGVAGVLLFAGALQTLFFKSNAILGDFDHVSVAALPDHTVPRLLPRSGIRDDVSFSDSKEIHLARHPVTGDFVWTGEWHPSFFAGGSRGVAVERLDELVNSQVLPARFAHSVAGHGPGTIKWDAKLRHPLSRIQYPVLVPTGPESAVALLPYMGY